MGRRLRRLGGEVARFTAVNGLATLVAVLLFNLLVHGVPDLFGGPLHEHVILTYVLANSVGMVISYQGSRRWAFKHREAVGVAGGALNYMAINLMSFLIPATCLWVSRNVLRYDDALSDNVAGNVVGALLGTTFRFWAFRTFVFTAHRAGSTTGGARPAQWEQWPPVRRLSVLPAPEVRPRETELIEHEPEQGQADPDHVVRVSRYS